MSRILIVTDPASGARADAWRAALQTDPASCPAGSGDDLLRAVREHAPDLLIVCGFNALTALPLEWPAGGPKPAVLADLSGWRPSAWAQALTDERAAAVRARSLALSRTDHVLCDHPAAHGAVLWAMLGAGLPDAAARVHLAEHDPLPDTLRAWLERPHPEAQPVRGPGAPATIGSLDAAARLRKGSDLVRRALRARIAPHQRGDGIVMVTRGDLFPTDHGAAVKIVETARALSRLGRRVGIVSERRDAWIIFEDGRHREERYPWSVRLRAWPLPVAKLRHLTRDLPESNAFLYLPLTDHSFRARTAHVVRELGAGVLQAEFPAYADPCLAVARPLGLPVVLVEHNVEYLRLREQLPELTDAQFQRFRAIELDLARRCDATVCVSDNDRRRLAAEGVPPRRLHTIPHGVDLDAFDAPPEPGLRARFDIPEGAPLLAFHGTFSYPPNREALAHFSSELLPRLERHGLAAHVLAIGRGAPVDAPHPRIHFTGSVEHLGPWLKAADLAVVPLTDGGGTRMKIVDCFAAGVPVVSTAKGIEGIPAVHRREAWIGDDWQRMAEAIAHLLAHPEEAAEMARRAREMAASLDWTKIGERYLALYATL